jgi:hypothetical protein
MKKIIISLAAICIFLLPVLAARTQEELSASDKAKNSGDMVDAMRQTLSNLLKMVEETQKEEDTIKLDCLNKKYDSAKGYLDIAEKANMLVQESLVKNDKIVLGNEYQKVSLAQNSIDAQMAEANKCGGQEVTDDNEIQVTVTEPTNVIAGDNPAFVNTPTVEGQPENEDPNASDAFDTKTIAAGEEGGGMKSPNTNPQPFPPPLAEGLPESSPKQ